MADKKTSNVTIGASDNFQRGIPSYGKPNETDTVTLDQYGTLATFTTATTLKGGDVIISYPFLTTAPITSATVGDITMTIFRFVPRKGFQDDEQVVVSLVGGEDATAVAVAIESALALSGFDSLFKVSVQDTNVVRIQALDMIATLVIDEDIPNVGFPTDERGKYAYVTLGLDIEDEISVVTNPYYFTNDSLTDAERTNLEYEVMRSIGESTGSSFDISYNSEDYKGNKPVVIQSEIIDATSQFNVSSLVFTYDNLLFLKGWAEVTGAFMSGVTTGTGGDVRSFDFTGNSKPKEFEFVSLHRKADGIGLLMILCPRVTSTQNEISLEKAFRVYDDTFEIVRATDKTVALIVNL